MSLIPFFSCQDNEETLNELEQCTYFMSKTLNDVLSMQKIEEGALVLKQSKCSLRIIAQNVISSLKVSIISKNLDLKGI